MATLLSVREITLRFGGIVALDGVSFDVEAGQVSGLIGPNGAGKTTAFNVITRLYTPDEGELELDGASLLQTPAYRIVERGIARTFQNINLFKSMSVLENVLLGAYALGRGVKESDALATLDYVGLGSEPTTSPRRCRTGSRSASRSRGLSPRSLACSCSTSRPAASTTRRSRSSATSSSASATITR